MDSFVLSPWMLYCCASISRCCIRFSWAFLRIFRKCRCALRRFVWHSCLVCGSLRLSGEDILDLVLLMAEMRFVCSTNCRKYSFRSLTLRLASLSSGDHGGRSLRLLCCSAFNIAVVMLLSIWLRCPLSRCLLVGLEWADLIRWSMLSFFHRVDRYNRNVFVWTVLVDASPLTGAMVNGSCRPKSVCL